MIHSALEYLTHELDEYLKLRMEATESDEKIFLTSVANEDGVTIPDKSLGLSLINIEEERIFKEQQAEFRNDFGMTERRNPEIKLNLYILISANFQSKNSHNSADYAEGLKQLSYVIAFFQAKNVFTADNSPSMIDHDRNIRKLIVELYSYNFEQLYNFWTILGANYLPSVLYKVRLVTIQERAIQDISPPVEKIGLKTGGRQG